MISSYSSWSIACVWRFCLLLASFCWLLNLRMSIARCSLLISGSWPLTTSLDLLGPMEPDRCSDWLVWAINECDGITPYCRSYGGDTGATCVVALADAPSYARGLPVLSKGSAGEAASPCPPEGVQSESLESPFKEASQPSRWGFRLAPGVTYMSCCSLIGSSCYLSVMPASWGPPATCAASSAWDVASISCYSAATRGECHPCSPTGVGSSFLAELGCAQSPRLMPSPSHWNSRVP